MAKDYQPQLDHYSTSMRTRNRTCLLIRSPEKGYGFVAGNGKPTIVKNVFPGSPSENLLMKDDIIIEINGINVEEEERDKVIAMVQRCDSKMEITVRQPTSHQEFLGRAALTHPRHKVNENNNQKAMIPSQQNRFITTIDGVAPVFKSSYPENIINSSPQPPRPKSSMDRTRTSMRKNSQGEYVSDSHDVGELRRCNTLRPTRNIKIASNIIKSCLKVFLENGQTKTFQYDEHTTVRDLLTSLNSKLAIKLGHHFGLAVEHAKSVKRNQIHILDNNDSISMIAKIPYASHLRILYRMIYPPENVHYLYDHDKMAFDYLYQQSCNDIKLERFTPELKHETSFKLAALHIVQHVEATCTGPECNSGNAKRFLKIVDKEPGLSHFLPQTIVVNTKKLHRTILDYIKKNFQEHDLKPPAAKSSTNFKPSSSSSFHQLSLPLQQRSTSDHIKLIFLNILSQLPSYGAKLFFTGPSNEASPTRILINERHGISFLETSSSTKMSDDTSSTNSINLAPIPLATICLIKAVKLIKRSDMCIAEIYLLRNVTEDLISMTDKEASKPLIKLNLANNDSKEFATTLKGYYKAIKMHKELLNHDCFPDRLGENNSFDGTELDVITCDWPGDRDSLSSFNMSTLNSTSYRTSSPWLPHSFTSGQPSLGIKRKIDSDQTDSNQSLATHNTQFSTDSRFKQPAPNQSIITHRSTSSMESSPRHEDVESIDLPPDILPLPSSLPENEEEHSDYPLPSPPSNISLSNELGGDLQQKKTEHKVPPVNDRQIRPAHLAEVIPEVANMNGLPEIDDANTNLGRYGCKDFRSLFTSTSTLDSSVGTLAEYIQRTRMGVDQSVNGNTFQNSQQHPTFNSNSGDYKYGSPERISTNTNSRIVNQGLQSQFKQPIMMSHHSSSQSIFENRLLDSRNGDPSHRFKQLPLSQSNNYEAQHQQRYTSTSTVSMSSSDRSSSLDFQGSNSEFIVEPGKVLDKVSPTTSRQIPSQHYINGRGGGNNNIVKQGSQKQGYPRNQLNVGRFEISAEKSEDEPIYVNREYSFPVRMNGVNGDVRVTYKNVISLTHYPNEFVDGIPHTRRTTTPSSIVGDITDHTDAQGIQFNLHNNHHAISTVAVDNLKPELPENQYLHDVVDNDLVSARDLNETFQTLESINKFILGSRARRPAGAKKFSSADVEISDINHNMLPSDMSWTDQVSRGYDQPAFGAQDGAMDNHNDLHTDISQRELNVTKIPDDLIVPPPPLQLNECASSITDKDIECWILPPPSRFDSGRETIITIMPTIRKSKGAKYVNDGDLVQQRTFV